MIFIFQKTMNPSDKIGNAQLYFFLNGILVLSHWSLFKAKVLKITKMRKYVLNIFGPYLRQKSLKLPK